MRHRHLAVVLAAGVVAACSDQPTSPSAAFRDLDHRANVTPTTTLAQTIDALTARLFPKGLETAAGTRWDGIKAKYQEGLTDPAQMRVAQQRLTELVRWVTSKTDLMDAPDAPETRQAAAARLVTYMAMYVYEGPSTPVPTYNPGADAIAGVVSPTQETTITTPAGRAGILFQAGSVPEDAILTITQNPLSYPGNCNGPLQTWRCQYPLFYDFQIFPEQSLLVPAHIAVCHVPPSSERRPLDAEGEETVHDRLRLAHPAPGPGNPATPGGVVIDAGGENIEVLPLSSRVGESVVDCDRPLTIGSNALLRTVGRFASAVGRILTPAPLYAVDQGPEHLVSFFSPFNLVDTASRADLAVESVTATGTIESEIAEVYPGDAATLAFAITNRSPVQGGAATAASQPTAYGVYLSTDATIDDADVLLGTLHAIGGMVPDGPPVAVTGMAAEIPESTDPGSYYIGALVNPASTGLGEITTTNNAAGVALTVRARPGTITGTVVDAFTGAPIAGAAITSGALAATSDANGAFVLTGLAAGTHDLTASATSYLDGTRSDVAVASGETVSVGSIAISPVSAPTEVRIVLEWGACPENDPAGSAPCDLDAHLTGPTASESRFHVYYQSTVFADALTAANLDVDDVTGLGPEAITITQQAGAGVYRYYVHDYTNRVTTGSTALANSGVTVRVYRGETLLGSFTPPPGGMGTLWAVFELQGNVVTPVGTITDAGNPPVAANLIAGEGASSREDDRVEVVRSTMAATKP